MHGIMHEKTESNCHLCEFKSYNKSEVKRHIAGEHGQNELKAFRKLEVKAWQESFAGVCPFCAGTFNYLEQHIKFKHERYHSYIT